MKNTALVQGIRCDPLGEHLIPWTWTVFSHTARKWTPNYCISHKTIQNFQRRKEVHSRPTRQMTIFMLIKVNRRRSVNSIQLLYNVVQRSAVLADTDIHLIVKRQPMSVRICNILKNTGPIILILTLHVITIVFSTQKVPGGSFPYSDIEKGSAYIPGMYVGPFIISLYHYMDNNLQERFVLKSALQSKKIY